MLLLQKPPVTRSVQPLFLKNEHISGEGKSVTKRGEDLGCISKNKKKKEKKKKKERNAIRFRI